MPEPELIRCSSCGALNRVPGEKVKRGLEAVCGRCKKPLLAGASPVTVTDATFSSEVENWPIPVLVDLWAPWCGPCKMIAPVLDELAMEMAGRLRVAKLNVDENPATSGRFQVRGIPALLLFQGGREV